jgi:hypothetical protein
MKKERKKEKERERKRKREKERDKYLLYLIMQNFLIPFAKNTARQKISIFYHYNCLSSQAQSLLKYTYSLHLEGNLQSDIQEDLHIEREDGDKKEDARDSTCIAPGSESSKYLSFLSTSAQC